MLQIQCGVFHCCVQILRLMTNRKYYIEIMTEMQLVVQRYGARQPDYSDAFFPGSPGHAERPFAFQGLQVDGALAGDHQVSCSQCCIKFSNVQEIFDAWFDPGM